MADSDDRTYDDPSDILARIFDQELADLHVCKVARVERYDAATKRCDAQPIYKRIVVDDLGERTESEPLIPNVPVAWPGSGDLSLEFDIAKGAYVLLLFADHSLDRVADRTGQIDPLAQRDPGADRAHHLSDAVAYPIAGTKPLGKASSAAIHIKTGGIVRIGGDQPLVTKAEFMAHSHASNGAVPTDLITGTPKLRG